MGSPSKKSWLPTRKWAAAVVTAVAGWLAALINAGAVTASLKILAVTIVAQASVSYLVPNVDTPGGVPLATRVRRRARERGYGAVELLVFLAVFIVVVLLLVKLIDRL